MRESRDEAPQGSKRRARLSGTVDGVELALSYIYEDEPASEIVLPRLIGNPRYAEGLITDDVIHNGLVVVDFGDCRYVSDSFLIALLMGIKESGAAGILIRRATEETAHHVATLAAGAQVQAVEAL